MRTFWKYLALLIASLAGAAYAGYATAWFVWLTATPLQPGQLSRIQYDAYFWLTVFVVALFVAAFSTYKMIRLYIAANKLLAGMNSPNQSSEPTLASGTNPAGQEPRLP